MVNISNKNRLPFINKFGIKIMEKNKIKTTFTI